MKILKMQIVHFINQAVINEIKKDNLAFNRKLTIILREINEDGKIPQIGLEGLVFLPILVPFLLNGGKIVFHFSLTFFTD